ncbi:MAG: ATP-binding protein [Planctomycetes bacterium]|nr:ATP-binding protein [Planctomycetota bacterium]
MFETAAGEPSQLPTGSADDYKEVTVISGKGGTGKTTVTASFAQLARNKILADNDVDAADMHLLLKPAVFETHDFFGGVKATVDPSKCTACGKCAAACHFSAIRRDGPANPKGDITYRVEALACEGCGLCPLVCPVDAIESRPNMTGRWHVSSTACGPMVHARLGIAEENSGRLVARVRSRAAELARQLKQELILDDGPPGTGCPVIASVSGTDLVLVVTEPTVSGVHDMERVMRLADHFGVRTLVIINKSDLNQEQAERIRLIAGRHGSGVIGHIPFDSSVNDALMAGRTALEHGGPAANAIREAWSALRKELDLGT